MEARGDVSHSVLGVQYADLTGGVVATDDGFNRDAIIDRFADLAREDRLQTSAGLERALAAFSGGEAGIAKPRTVWQQQGDAALYVLGGALGGVKNLVDGGVSTVDALLFDTVGTLLYHGLDGVNALIPGKQGNIFKQSAIDNVGNGQAVIDYFAEVQQTDFLAPLYSAFVEQHGASVELWEVGRTFEAGAASPFATLPTELLVGGLASRLNVSSLLDSSTIRLIDGNASALVSDGLPDGIVYLRTDLTGQIPPYGGQAISETRYLARQAEHARRFPDSEFSFTMVDRAHPGIALDIAEHNYIQILTQGQRAKLSPLVSNQLDPVGPARRAVNGLPEPRK